ncbi:MAG: hypothetical protein ACP5O1_08370 [Phycisphaerae bacterium]
MRSWMVGFVIAATIASTTGGPLVAVTAEPFTAVRTDIEVPINLQTTGKPVPPMFMGYSIEWRLIGQLLGRQDGRFRATENSIKRLETFTAPMLLRIGGNSEDEAAFDLPTIHHLPKYVHIHITAATLKNVRRLAQATGCRYILVLNLGADKPALAVRLAKAALQYIGRFGRIWRHDSYPLGDPIRNPKSPIFASIHNLLKASTADGYDREMNWAVKVVAPCSGWRRPYWTSPAPVVRVSIFTCREASISSAAGLLEAACKVWPACSPQRRSSHGATGHFGKR